MITEEQYQKAFAIVTEYGTQQYNDALEQAKKDFPLGCKVRSKTGWSSGLVYGYGRAGNDVNLKVHWGNRDYSAWFRAKYATKEE